MAQPVTLITGASAGLGEEFARQYSRRGHRLVLAARRKDRLNALADELGNARAVEIDLGQPGAASRLVEDVAKAGEEVGLLINNAGFGLYGRFECAEPERLRQMIDLNCGALTELCRAVLPDMIARRSGGILNVASTAAFQPGPGMAVYFATKAFVLSLSEALHEENRKHGVSITALCPGPTRTEFGDVARFNSKAAFDRFAMQSEDVVREGIEALEGNRAVAITGIRNAIAPFAIRFLPRSLVRRAAGAVKF